MKPLRADARAGDAEAGDAKAGEHARFVVLMRDITGRRRAEKALRDSEERFRRVIEHAADAFFVHDSGGRIVEANQRA